MKDKNNIANIVAENENISEEGPTPEPQEESQEENSDKARGRRIARARKRAGLTQRQLSKIIGVSQGTVAMYETGGAEPRCNGLAKIARACDCSVDYLLGLTEYVQSSADLAKDALYHTDSLSSRAFELGERYDQMRDSEQSLCMAFVYMLSELSGSSTADDPGTLCYVNTKPGNDTTMTMTSVESYLKACVNSSKQTEETQENADTEGDKS